MVSIEGIKDYLKTQSESMKRSGALTMEKVIENLKEKKLTFREAAELLDIGYWEMQQIVDEEGIPLIDIAEEEIKKRQTNKYKNKEG